MPSIKKAREIVVEVGPEPWPEHIPTPVPDLISREELINKYYEEGWSLNMIASEYDISERTLRRYMDKWNLQRRDYSQSMKQFVKRRKEE